MENLTFEAMPKMLAKLLDELNELKQILMERNGQSPVTAVDKWFNLDELIAYHPNHPAKPTVYLWTMHNLIPFHKTGHKLRFLKSEIDNWLAQGKQKTQSELAAEAQTFGADTKTA